MVGHASEHLLNVIRKGLHPSDMRIESFNRFLLRPASTHEFIGKYDEDEWRYDEYRTTNEAGSRRYMSKQHVDH